MTQWPEKGLDVWHKKKINQSNSQAIKSLRQGILQGGQQLNKVQELVKFTLNLSPEGKKIIMNTFGVQRNSNLMVEL